MGKLFDSHAKLIGFFNYQTKISLIDQPFSLRSFIPIPLVLTPG